MDALAEQQMGGWVLGASAIMLVALGTWVARTGSTRLINGVDFSRIDPRDHARVATIVGQSAAGIGLVHLVVAAGLLLASEPIRQEWIIGLAVALPPLAFLAAMHLRMQGLYKR